MGQRCTAEMGISIKTHTPQNIRSRSIFKEVKNAPSTILTVNHSKLRSSKAAKDGKDYSRKSRQKSSGLGTT